MSNASVDDALKCIGELYLARRMQAVEQESLRAELRRLQQRAAELEALDTEPEDPAA